MAYVVWPLLRPSPSRSTHLASAGAGQLRMTAPGGSPRTGCWCGRDSSRRRLRTPRSGIHPRGGNVPGQLGFLFLGVGSWDGHPGAERALRLRPVPRERRPPRCLPGPSPGWGFPVSWCSMCLASAGQHGVALVSKPMCCLRGLSRARRHSPCRRSCNWHMWAVHCCI